MSETFPSLSSSPVCHPEGENVAPRLAQLSPALPFTSRLLAAQVPPLRVYVPGTVGVQPAGARSFDPSVIDARVCPYWSHHLHPKELMHVRSFAQFSPPRARMKSVRNLGVRDRQMWAAVIQT